MKPVELVMHMINNSSKRGDIILDAFCGSGTTILACQNTGRKCRSIEKDPKYVAVELERMNIAFGIRGTLIK